MNLQCFRKVIFVFEDEIRLSYPGVTQAPFKTKVLMLRNKPVKLMTGTSARNLRFSSGVVVVERHGPFVVVVGGGRCLLRGVGR